MKTNCWLVLGTILATSAVAQVNTNKLPEIPPPATTATLAAPAVAPVENKTVAPVKKAAPAKARKKARAKASVAPVEKKAAAQPVALVPGPATVAVDNVNLRGQAGLKGEVVGHAKKGDAITVVSQINLDKPKAGEPAQWAKVLIPSGTKVWVNSKFIDGTNKTVSVKKLNLRGGPGENYSVLGILEKGATIAEVVSKGDWTQIEAPTNAFAFVAASLLKQEAPAAPAVQPIPATTNTVAEPQPIVAAPTAAPAVETNVPAPAPAIAPAIPVVPAPVIETNLPPPPPRVVTHEGFVRSSVSLVAPTYFELYDPATGTAINYLYTTSTNLDISRYRGLHIVATGEEGMDARWKDTPVLTIQKIYVLSTNAPAAKKP
ncbi:MAG: SH3 domain-containing protein [Verrucomicrobiota bacterium]